MKKLRLVALAACGLSLVLVTLASVAAAAAAQTISPLNGLTVVDANGKKVGGIVASFKRPEQAPPTNAVALEVGGQVVRVNVIASDFVTTTAIAVNFESLDCSGTPYVTVANVQAVDLAEDLLSPASIIQAPGRTVYRVDLTATPTTGHLFNSFFYFSFPPDNEPNAGCQQMTSPNTDLGPVIPVVALGDLLSVFTPPFHVVPTSAGCCCGDCNGDGTVTVDEILTSVNGALNGCRK
jgi:hypothetical protein